MPDKITRLHPVGSTLVAADRRAVVVAELELALKQARAGEIDELLLMLKGTGIEWDTRSSNLGSMVEWIGRLEVVQRDLLNLLAPPTPLADIEEDDEDE
jgi:hypothetical protein